jgi:hypothetical protein
MKTLIIDKVGKTQMYKARWDKGGEVPEKLKGIWNKRVWLQKAIDTYMVSHKEKVESNGKNTGNTSRV